MRDRGCHMPPRLGCALGATEVKSSRRNLNLVYPQVNEYTFLIQTLRPIHRKDKCAQQTRRARQYSAYGGIRHVKTGY